MSKDVKHTKDVEDEMLKKEAKLEKQVQEHGWGENLEETHEISEPIFPKFESDFKHKAHEFGDKIRGGLNNFFSHMHSWHPPMTPFGHHFGGHGLHKKGAHGLE